ncbi:MAG: hypothetical protein ABW221_14340 [Vicinamibacteria bacterium]
MNALDGLKILGTYLAGAAIALLFAVLLDGQELDAPYGGMTFLLVVSGASLAAGQIARTKRPNELVLFGVTVLAVLGVAAVCTVHATVGWKDGWAGPLAFALFNAVLHPVAQARGERRRLLPGAILERPIGDERA